MKYIELSSLQNKYFSISEYRGEANSVTLKGFYSENELNISVSDFSNILVIPNTKFRFIVQADSSTIFTSETFYNDLVRAKNNQNPYFINSALNPDIFVKISIDVLKETFTKQIEFEKQYGVTVVFNNLFNADGSINYIRFAEYIDWVVSQPTIDEIVGNSVLPSSKLSQFNIADFNFPEPPDDDGFLDPTEGPGPVFENDNGSPVPVGPTPVINDGTVINDNIIDTTITEFFDPTQGPGISLGGGENPSVNTSTVGTSPTFGVFNYGQGFTNGAAAAQSVMLAQQPQKPSFNGTWTGQSATGPDGSKWVWIPFQGGWTKA